MCANSPTSVARTSVYVSPSSASCDVQAQTSGLRRVNQLVQNLSAESIAQGPNNGAAPLTTGSSNIVKRTKRLSSRKVVQWPDLSEEGENKCESRLDNWVSSEGDLCRSPLCSRG
ncbi:uncharacterized protein LACBIDRAFT_314527 [Laccaria bicolor S238N-H82]|uniref:Predicted protein n=1 Tax=Laccaria bicolor (strain S238N-H82 / ATCC MYA-4686) TaxID=486041 RepID=B0DYR4_LACBS|nr:uncharacterized protein LACBIDRAFT_314527 [Laccaria bicolor S238N-H82]EDR00294.1 predicted protein [Laccaria bicolor S238N-H82]|eukprot:XP_001889046.1 predicted protein [Laccaria bicolor S238N-H82]